MGVYDMKDLFNETKILKSTVELTDIDLEIYKNFDLDFDGESSFEVPRVAGIPDDFNIGVVCGSSGSGKSSILKNFGEEENIEWKYNRSVASHFINVDDAIDRLTAVGLNNVPTWAKPRHVLSMGEGFRADLARKLKDNAVIDEYTSVVNRDVAKSCSKASSKYIKRNNLKNIVLASCHYDILDWLEPDWVYLTDSQKMTRGYHRPRVSFTIHDCTKRYWEMFKKHHYLTSEIPTAVKCYLAIWENNIVGFCCSIPMPGYYPPLYEGDIRKCYRECRTVILPDFQGLGIGTKLHNAIADMHIENNVRYFCKTSHVRIGEYNDRSKLWKATSMNKKMQTTVPYHRHDKKEQSTRFFYSHEYMGPDNKTLDPKWNAIVESSNQINLFDDKQIETMIDKAT